jgi:ABC-type phosphate transport system substrate-binding protein
MSTPKRAAQYAMALIFALAAAASSADDAEFKLVVNESNDASSLTPDDVLQYFLKKKTTWPGGQPVQPVDLSEESPARRSFSKALLKKDVGAVRSYWQTQIFSGRGVPPPEKASDAGVLAYVEANRGAIGYVSAGVVIPRGVKEIKLN